ncbi:Cro/CI family transcriptional regulator [Burkholderia pseudomallei]|uniref:transcriptional regulator n=1 Tax=Burkholderia pseudomallei TaxID=28450 RepID=UPI002DBCFBB4|nr:Cro/CI family transcriptional regulator [Burkholderia pseudomallei]MEB5483946.1 Cro/CI family transcriptional regulator [Burkholderia pseudomallei]MEB5490799.1 Cro/CI family transcriptional regulator [Burkholderia pseudomallei]MEB5497497.1 Cro/CI family transcriptional regulator [Burkholderia pseudomallei]MEB5502772.1 Cro/CI family transcriptional regulator [Burkholderia pseudomallei]MEB5510153.1 Cro/CI family transcriptional regulator [Burkholderia pseudomallei]
MDKISPIARAAAVVGSATVLANSLGVTKAAVSQWKRVGVPIRHCVAIECATRGKVSRRDLRPDDWHFIWPELSQQKETTE